MCREMPCLSLTEVGYLLAQTHMQPVPLHGGSLGDQSMRLQFQVQSCRCRQRICLCDLMICMLVRCRLTSRWCSLQLDHAAGSMRSDIDGDGSSMSAAEMVQRTAQLAGEVAGLARDLEAKQKRLEAQRQVSGGVLRVDHAACNLVAVACFRHSSTAAEG